MTEEVSFTVPLPPPALRANTRAPWYVRKDAADVYSELVMWAAGPLYSDVQACVHGCADYGYPWAKAAVHYEWRYAGARPDLGNIPGNVKYLQDIICKAPKLPAGVLYRRYHLGLVENDREITQTYEISKVATKAEECVVVTLRREEP